MAPPETRQLIGIQAARDLAQARKPPKWIHREAVADGRLVDYYRAGGTWRIYWTLDAAGGGLVGAFDTLSEARRDAESVLAAEPTA